VNILVAASEVVPFAKTGGLADVCGALPNELARSGHQPTVILPAYRQTRYCGQRIEPLGISFIVPIGSKTVTGHLLQSTLPGGKVPVILVQQDDYYDRDELYRNNGEDYPDNCERFIFFSRAVLETIRLLGLNVDVVHCNDWQTGLVPAYLKTEYAAQPRYERIATLFTIHNIAYQGQFWHWDMLLTGLDWKYFNWHQMEYYGKLNLLKTGMVFADAISTVSPRYAQEIQTPHFGRGLEGVLQHRRASLFGILNGIDTNVWNPAADTHLAAHYDAATVSRGKPKCKAALQQELGLAQRPNVPLVGMIGRMDPQKGFDLVANVIPEWVGKTDVQWVILGKGEPDLQVRFKDLANRYPDKVAVHLDQSDLLAHKIEAGTDMFLMPSRFEPCGLNQMYSHRYGTVPVVREVGGLADTVVDATAENLAAGTANGFSFREDNALALSETLKRACDAFAKPEVWSKIVATAMRQDWSWARSAAQYVRVYEQIAAAKKGPAGR
jgi:starch synthase